MILINYILDGYEELVNKANEKGIHVVFDEQSLFENESQALYAQSWDAEIFTKKILQKELSETNFQEVYGAFKAVVRHIELENMSYEELYANIARKNEDEKKSLYQHYKNGTKKRNLFYNDNYEQSSEEDFD